MSNEKKKGSYSTIVVDGQKVMVRQRLQFQKPKKLNDIDSIKQSTREGLKVSLNELRNQILEWKRQEPDAPLVKDVRTELSFSQSELSKLYSFIEATEQLLEKGNDFGLALNMFSIGESVGRLNHLEGWFSALKKDVQFIKIQSKGPVKQKLLAEKTKELLRSFAIGYFIKHPTSTVKQMVSELRSNPNLKQDAKKYSTSTLTSKILCGTKKIALERLS